MLITVEQSVTGKVQDIKSWQCKQIQYRAMAETSTKNIYPARSDASVPQPTSRKGMITTAMAVETTTGFSMAASATVTGSAATTVRTTMGSNSRHLTKPK